MTEEESSMIKECALGLAVMEAFLSLVCCGLIVFENMPISLFFDALLQLNFCMVIVFALYWIVEKSGLFRDLYV